MQCPRRAEAPHISEQFKREDDTQGDRCVYCGSLTEEAFFKAIETNCRLGTTTKSYKIYVHRPNPRMSQKRIVGTANFDKSDDPNWKQATAEDVELSKLTGWTSVKVGDWIQLGPEDEMNQDKFYFQHLSVPNRQRFVEMMNAKTLRLDHPFTVLPFFCQ